MGITWFIKPLQKLLGIGIMEGKENQHARICVLEKLFDGYHTQLSRHMQEETDAFKDLNKAIDRNSSIVLLKLEQVQHEYRKELLDSTNQLRSILDKDFISKSELELKLTQLRNSTIKEIRGEKKSAYAEILRVLVVIIFTLSFSGWFYINVIKELPHKDTFHGISKF